MIRTGLDRILDDVGELTGKRFALLSHGAAVTADLTPCHLALLEAGAKPELLLGPEHGYHGVEQDMVGSEDTTDPWTGLPIASLYSATEDSLRPRPELFRDLDILLIDLQDVGARYYTYAASAVWAAEIAAGESCEVWVLDRPNPLGGVCVEGNLRREGFTSFVGAFPYPVRHGLTLGEIHRLEARRAGWSEALRVWTMDGWSREMGWLDLDRPWLPPSPNLPALEGVWVYPGACLIEATTLSEGRGTTRPFQLIGAPDIDPRELSVRMSEKDLPGVTFPPTYFRPQYQKHAGEVCGGVQIVVTDMETFKSFRTGVVLLAELMAQSGDAFEWRPEPYEFVSDRPAIDLLAGDDGLREALETGDGLAEWIESWKADEDEFLEERRPILLYAEENDG